MSEGVRRQHHRTFKIGFAKNLMSWLLQREIGEPIVHKIYRTLIMPEAAVAQLQCRGIRYDCIDPVMLEEALEQQKLRVEILLLRTLVDDGNAMQRLLPTFETPFGEEHIEEGLFQGIERVRPRHHGPDWLTACTLGARQRKVEEGAACIGIDLDELGLVGCQVEVEAHEHAPRPGFEPRYVGHPLEDEITIGGQRYDRLGSPDDFCHPLEALARHENGKCSEHMGISVTHGRKDSG